MDLSLLVDPGKGPRLEDARLGFEDTQQDHAETERLTHFVGDIVKKLGSTAGRVDTRRYLQQSLQVGDPLLALGVAFGLGGLVLSHPQDEQAADDQHDQGHQQSLFRVRQRECSQDSGRLDG